MIKIRAWRYFAVMMALVLVASVAAAIVPPSPVQAATEPMVAAGLLHTVGLKSDGTVVAVGYNTYGQCNVTGWTNITQVAAGYWHTVGLKADGTVVAVGYNADGQCNVGGWTNITQVAAGGYHTVGLKSDGTVVAVGNNAYGQCNVAGWTNITQVAAGQGHTAGLKSDGTAVAVGYNADGQCNVGGWTNITQVTAGWLHTVGLKSDGTVVAVGDNYYGQCNVSGWNLGAATPPTVTTEAASGIGTNSATLNMSYTLGGYSSVDVRFAYKKSADPTWTYTSWVSKSVSDTHAEPLSGLDTNTTYDFKAQLRYYSSVIEGDTVQFLTGSIPPAVTTNAASDISTDSATLNMSYTVGDYSPVNVRFAYKKSTDPGWTYTNWTPKVADGTHAEPLTGLDSGTQYDFRAELKYDATEIQGSTLQFTTGTLPPPPPAPRASPSPPRLPPADVRLNNISVSPGQAQAGQPVTVLANVVNNGASSGSYNVALRINGRVEQQRTVEVSPGAAYPVKFIVTKSQPGNYDVAIEGQRASFTVLGGDTSRAPVSGGLIIIIVMAVLILATAVVLMMTFRRPA